jgi:hypothetical protein
MKFGELRSSIAHLRRPSAQSRDQEGLQLRSFEKKTSSCSLTPEEQSSLNRIIDAGEITPLTIDDFFPNRRIAQRTFYKKVLHSAEASPCTFLLGSPCSGKTSFAHWAAWVCSDGQLAIGDPLNPDFQQEVGVSSCFHTALQAPRIQGKQILYLEEMTLYNHEELSDVLLGYLEKPQKERKRLIIAVHPWSKVLRHLRATFKDMPFHWVPPMTKWEVEEAFLADELADRGIHLSKEAIDMLFQSSQGILSLHFILLNAARIAKKMNKPESSPERSCITAQDIALTRKIAFHTLCTYEGENLPHQDWRSLYAFISVLECEDKPAQEFLVSIAKQSRTAGAHEDMYAEQFVQCGFLKKRFFGKLLSFRSDLVRELVLQRLDASTSAAVL